MTVGGPMASPRQPGWARSSQAWAAVSARSGRQASLALWPGGVWAISGWNAPRRGTGLGAIPKPAELVDQIADRTTRLHRQDGSQEALLKTS